MVENKKTKLVGDYKVAAEDYALRKVPRTWRWSWFYTINSGLGIGTALFYPTYGAILAATFGLTTALIGLWLISIPLQLLIGYTVIARTSRYHIDTDMVSRSAGFGFVGSVIATVVYALTFLYYFGYEGDIMASGISAYTHINVGIVYIVLFFAFIPLILWGMRLMTAFQSYTLPIWLAFIAFLSYEAFFNPHYAANILPQISTYPKLSGLLLVGFMSTMLGIVPGASIDVGDYSRFAKNGKSRAGVFLTALLPNNLFAWAIGTLGIFIGAAFLQSNAGIYAVSVMGLLGMLFVILSQLRINITNVYSASLAFANFFSRVGRILPGRWVLAIASLIIGTILEFSNVVAHTVLFSTFLGIFVAGWVGSLIANLAINKRFFSPGVYEYRRPYLPAFSTPGFVSTVLAFIIGLSMYITGLVTNNAVLFAWSSVTSFGIAIILAIIIGYVRRNEKFFIRPTIQYPGEPGVVPCPNCKVPSETTDLFPCPFLKKYICSNCCMRVRDCGEICKKMPDSELLSIPKLVDDKDYIIKGADTD